MILGIGSDLVNTRRIDAALVRHGRRFEERLFTDEERKTARKNPFPARSYAKRFAAKEALSKALGTGIGAGVSFRDMEVVSLTSGKPVMKLSGGAKTRLAFLTPEGMTARIHVTITDDASLAQAFVVVEAVQKEFSL